VLHPPVSTSTAFSLGCPKTIETCMSYEEEDTCVLHPPVSIYISDHHAVLLYAL